MTVREMTAAERIAAGLDGRREGRGWRCRCPIHRGHSLVVTDGRGGRPLLKCWAGCASRDILAELRRHGLLDGNADSIRPDPAEMARRREAEARDRQWRIANALDFWEHETVLPYGTAVERYWHTRGLALPIPSTIRASRSWLRHPSGGSRPAMVALVQHVEHGAIAIHRTWLQVDGGAKASLDPPRMAFGPIGGGGVRLAPAGELLLVAEGIETGLSAQQSCALPCWAALSSSGLTALVLPPSVRTVVILADNDANAAGARAAHDAARRWLSEGRGVRIAMPSEPGTDFNDVLLGSAHARTMDERDGAA